MIDQMQNKKIIFIHGYMASPQINFYPAISKKLDELGVDYVIPTLPGHKHPKSKEWLEIIDREVKASKRPVILVGHCLSTRAILLYLNKYEQRVDTIILVAPFNNDFKTNANRNEGRYAGFFEEKLDIEKIKRLVNKFIVIHSLDDTTIPFAEGEKMALDLSASLVSLNGRNHFCNPEDADDIYKVLAGNLLG